MKKINNFFFNPNGGGPKWENFGLIGILAAAFSFYLATMGIKSK